MNLLPKDERNAQSHDIAKRVRPRVAAIADAITARRSPSPRCRRDRRCCRPSSPRSTGRPSDEPARRWPKSVRDLRVDDRRRGRRLVRRGGPAARSRFVDRQGEGRPARHQRRDHRAHAAPRRRPAAPVDLLHRAAEREDVDIVVRTAARAAARPDDLLALHVRSATPTRCPSRLDRPSAAGSPARTGARRAHASPTRRIYRKNLMPVTYVIGDVAGEVESPVYAILEMNEKLADLDTRDFGGSRPDDSRLQRHPALHRPRNPP